MLGRGLRLGENFIYMSSVRTENFTLQLSVLRVDRVLVIVAVRATIVGVVQRRSWMPCLATKMLTDWLTN